MTIDPREVEALRAHVYAMQNELAMLRDQLAVLRACLDRPAGEGPPDADVGTLTAREVVIVGEDGLPRMRLASTAYGAELKMWRENGDKEPPTVMLNSGHVSGGWFGIRDESGKLLTLIASTGIHLVGAGEGQDNLGAEVATIRISR